MNVIVSNKYQAMLATLDIDIIKSIKTTHYYNDDMKKIEGIMWLYICVDSSKINDEYTSTYLYTFNKKTYPFLMLAYPLGITELTYERNTGTDTIRYDNDNLIEGLVKKLNGTIVECNTAYRGKRFESKDHLETFKLHGWNAFRVNLLDKEGPDFVLDIPEGKVIKKNYVGKDIVDYAKEKLSNINISVEKDYSNNFGICCFIRLCRCKKVSVSGSEAPCRSES